MFKGAPPLPRPSWLRRLRCWLFCCVLPQPYYNLYSARTLHRLGSAWTMRGVQRVVKRNQWTIEEISPVGSVFVDDLQPGMCPCLCGRRAEDCVFKPKDAP